MSWAMRRRIIVFITLGALGVAFAATVFISVTHQTPSCVDGVQNQNETGVDCGGSCTYLCTAQVQPPTVLFTKAVSNGAGRVDVIASIENKNATAAAKNVPYRVRVYGANQVVLREVTGTLDLPPAKTQPVFIPGLASTQQTVTNAFLEIDSAAPKWFTLSADPRVVPKVSNTKLGGTNTAPRIEATLSNSSATPLFAVQVVVLVRDVEGNVIGASSTVLPTIPGQGAAVASFTWNGAFVGTATNIEVVPIILLSVGPHS